MVAGENWVAANKVGCDARLDPRLESPIMQAPSYTGQSSGSVNELGTPVDSSGNGIPAIVNKARPRSSDTNRSALLFLCIP